MTSLWDRVADNYDPPPNPYHHDPVLWVRERLAGQLWSKQIEILESIRDNPRTAVHSCHGAGKSRVAATAAAWWVDQWPAGSRRVASSAPSNHQVEGILWFELHRVFEAAKKAGHPLPGKLNLVEWYIGSLEVAFGRKPADQDVLDRFQGIHASEGVLVILDESGGIPPELWEAAGKLTTSPKDRLLAIGNPDYEGSQFSKVCSTGSGWHVIHIDGLETPNFTDEDVPADAPLISQQFIDTVVKDYGKDSPQYVGQVRGRFPRDRTDGIIPWSWAGKCRGELAAQKVGPLRVPVELGVDVAGSEDGAGGDETVIWPRFGLHAGDGRDLEDGGDVRRMHTQDSEVIVDAVVAMVKHTRATSVKVDWNGLGFGVYGSLCRRLPDEVDWPCEVHKVVFGGAARESTEFVNQRAEMWWAGRLLAREGAWDLTGVDGRSLSQLTEPRWFEHKTTGRKQVEKKDQIRKRLGRSPDDADALLMAFYTPPDEDPMAQAIATKDQRLKGRRRR